MSLLKRKSADLQELRDITDDVDEALYVPYACHVDDSTILTKNGELMQTLKIVGFTYEDITQESENLRDIIRESLRGALDDTRYAVWLHTIRRKTSLNPPGKFPPNFSQVMNAKWRDLNGWEHKFINEVYITIVIEGQTSEMRQPHHFIRSLVPGAERAHRWRFLDGSLAKLTATVDRLHTGLQRFGAKKLSMHEQGGIILSEPLGFLNKLATLTDQAMPVPEIGLDSYLTAHEVTFGFNAMEVRLPDDSRRFGSVLTVKEYREVPPQSIDLLLQVQAEFIISQCMDFINAKQVKSEYETQAEFFQLSEETELPELIGLNELINDTKNSSLDFGEQQINMLVLGDSVKEMEENTRRMVRALNGVGILAVREDIKLEEAYWSQFPANFEFLRRLNSIAATRVGGFANISNVPAGLALGGIWGPPVTVINTAVYTPYFFNFHVGDNGHTTIIGPEGAGKTVLLNFLLSEAQKFQAKLYFLDSGRGAEVFLRGIGGEYQFIERRKVHESQQQDRPTFHKIPRMNPFCLDDTPQNRSFLLVWLDALLRADKFYRPEMSEESWPHFAKALDHIYALPKPLRTLGPVIEFLKELSPKLAAKMYGWYKEGDLARWFDNEVDTLDMSQPILGLELKEVMDRPRVAPAVIAYLLHRLMMQLDGSPTIIVLDEAWDMMGNPILASRMGGWLEMLRSKNCIAILATEKADEATSNPLSAPIMQQVATQIYLPNQAINGAEYEKIFGLSTIESDFVRRMSRKDRQFLMKRGQQSIVGQLDLKNLKAQLAVLSSGEQERNLMSKLISERGLPPENWIAEFFQQVEAA